MAEPIAQTIKLFGPALPRVRAGMYDVSAAQTVTLPGSSQASYAAPVLKIAASAPRFILEDESVVSVWPPNRITVDLAGQVPSINLSPATLPWARPMPTLNGVDLPWMALIVLRDDEVCDTVDQFKERCSAPATMQAPHPLGVLTQRNVTFSSMRTLPLQTLDETLPERWASRAMEPGDRRFLLEGAAGEAVQQKARFISLSVASASSVLPAIADLPFIAHTRCEKGTGPATQAQLVANRMIDGPVPSTYRVLLISLEGALTPRPGSDPIWWFANPPSRDALCTFPVLYEWRVTHGVDPNSFESRAMAISPGTLSWDTTRIPAAAAWLGEGFTPIEHVLREGNHTVSWYRGPAMPVRAPASRTLAVPVRAHHLTPRQLCRIDTDSGLLDASYAVAWETGRLMAAADAELARALLTRKQALARRRLVDGSPGLGVHTTFDSEAWDGLLGAWLERIVRLEALPLGLILPSAELLPPETLRRFHLDPGWFSAFLAGASTIGEITNEDVEPPLCWREPRIAIHGWDGYFLRTSLLSDMPDLHVAGSLGEAFMTPLSTIRYGADMLLLLFEQAPDRIHLARPLHQFHLGLEIDPETNSRGFYPRNDSGACQATWLAATFRDAERHTLDFARWHTELSPDDPVHAAARIALSLTRPSASIGFPVEKEN